jgi:hypothetical protein
MDDHLDTEKYYDEVTRLGIEILKVCDEYDHDNAERLCSHCCRAVIIETLSQCLDYVKNSDADEPQGTAIQ